MKRLLAALACSLALAACSDDSSSTADPPSPTTSAPSDPTSSPTEEAESPEAFLDRWIDLNTSMQNTGDTEDFRVISAKCRPCLGTADQVDAIYAAGGYVKTEGWSARSVKVSGTGTDGSVELTIEVRSAPTELKENSDAVVQRLPGGRFRELMSLAPKGSSWVVTNLEQVAQ